MENNCEVNDATRAWSYPTDYKETTGLVHYEASPEVNRYINLYSILSNQKLLHEKQSILSPSKKKNWK